MSEKLTDIDKLILDYLDGKNSREELDLLKAWTAHKDNSKELSQLSDIFLASAIVNPNSMPDTNKAWNEWKKKNTNPQIQLQNKYSVLKNYFFRTAAIAIILLISGVIAYTYLKVDNNKQLSFSEYNVPRGSRSHIYLPDGTSVWLNAQSTLKYSQNFGVGEREVVLEGEAYFDVVRNENLPFLVRASDAVVKVLGTAFNVKAYPDENFIETTVVRGKVQVSSPQIKNDGQDIITLIANQKVKILKENITNENSITSVTNSDTLHKKTEKLEPIVMQKFDFSPHVTAAVYTSWKDSQWIIERETLKELAIKIERRYNVVVEFKDSELEQYIFSGKLKDESLEQVLQAISVAAPISYAINQKSIFFYKNKKFQRNN